jgi:hypothetical protein
MFGLGHIDMAPVMYGVIIFLGIWNMFSKLMHLRIIALTIEICVFCLVFSLHGGSMAGGFAATVAALLAGAILPRRIGR